MTPLDFPPRYRMVRPAPPELIRQIELADEAFNRNPDGLLGTVNAIDLAIAALVVVFIALCVVVGSL